MTLTYLHGTDSPVDGSSFGAVEPTGAVVAPCSTAADADTGAPPYLHVAPSAAAPGASHSRPAAVPQRRQKLRAQMLTRGLRHALLSARVKQGLSQRALAEVIDCAASAISMWETGGSVPTLESTIQWARALGFELALVPQDPAPGPGR